MKHSILLEIWHNNPWGKYIVSQSIAPTAAKNDVRRYIGYRQQCISIVNIYKKAVPL